MRRYDTEHYRNEGHRFPVFSVTGNSCPLGCEHCRGQMLREMVPAPAPGALLRAAERAMANGCRGLLISGGCDESGAVPLAGHLRALGELKSWGLQVVVHAGLLDRRTAEGLKAAGVDQVLVDVVGDEETARQVLHLNKTPADYLAVLRMLHELSVPTVPHAIVGLHYGEIRGELAALEMIASIAPAAVVLVLVRPLPGTPMASTPHVSPESFARVAAVARLLLPSPTLALGCARPAGPLKPEYERLALLAGVNAIAYPEPATVSLAAGMGLGTSFTESCCSLAGLDSAGYGV